MKNAATPDLKVAHVIVRNNRQLFALNKGWTDVFPPDLFFGDTTCRVLRGGVEVAIPKNLPHNGLYASTLRPGDRVEVIGAADFYGTLDNYSRLVVGIIWLEPCARRPLVPSQEAA